MERSSPRPVEPDPARAERWVDDPRQAGVLSVRSVPRSRWYTQAEYSAWIRERLKKVLPDFDSFEDFVDFATQAAQDRRYPAPNYKAPAGADSVEEYEHAWDRTRIVRILSDLMNGSTIQSNSIQFFNAAIDELEGVGRQTRVADAISRAGREPREPVVQVEETLPTGEVEIVEAADEYEGLRRRYVELLLHLIEHLDIGNRDDLLDRVERILFS